MINTLFNITSKKQLVYWFAFHLFLGLVSLISIFPLIFWFYLLLFNRILVINRLKNREIKLNLLISALVYFAPFEMLCRMVYTSPFIPFELGKYITFILLIYGISISKNRGNTGWLIVILLVPGILLGWRSAPDYRYIIFNVMGLINLGLGLVFFSSLWIVKFKLDFTSVVRLLAYPLLSALLFAFMRTPNYDEIDFQLGANFEASGGFGSNQVSTAFGLGMFLVFYLWLRGSSFSGLPKLFDLGIVGFFFFQGLLTFSRGGIIGGVLGILLLVYNSTRLKNTATIYRRISRLLFLGLPIILLLAVTANEITGGKLLLRYQGETEGTLAGAKEKSANTLTTGRYEIFLGDLEIFMDNPIFGVGVNASRFVRRLSPDVVAHVELSRLLAEHGIMGLVIFLVLTAYLFTRFSLLYSENVILYILFVIGFYTTFHAATRTFMSPLLMSLAYIPLNSLKAKVPN